ncbi:MAG: HpcH/HpaI aldolase family protein [Planctomycetota bacterium]
MASGILMRPSRTLARMRAGGVATCVKCNTADPRIVDLIGRFDFDAVWLCMEHVPGSIDVVERQIMAARANDLDSVVRVRRGSYSDLTVPLEADAIAVMVPHVTSAEQAREVVSSTKFHPVGRRPWDGGNADGAYGMLAPAEYHRQANAERFTILQIEDPEGIDALDAIAAIEGYEMLLFGPVDYSQGLGCPGALDDPRIAEARRRVAEAARAHDKFAGTVGSPETIDALAAMGYQFINLGSDVLGLGDYVRRLAEALPKR